MAGSSPVKYRHNIGHGEGVGPLLSVLGIPFLRCPGMGAEIVFEVWSEASTSANYIRILYGGQPLPTRFNNATWDMVPVADFFGYIGTFIAGDVFQKCTGLEPVA